MCRRSVSYCHQQRVLTSGYFLHRSDSLQPFLVLIIGGWVTLNADLHQVSWNLDVPAKSGLCCVYLDATFCLALRDLSKTFVRVRHHQVVS
jgi:hypothetical protein